MFCKKEKNKCLQPFSAMATYPYEWKSTIAFKTYDLHLAIVLSSTLSHPCIVQTNRAKYHNHTIIFWYIDIDRYRLVYIQMNYILPSWSNVYKSPFIHANGLIFKAFVLFVYAGLKFMFVIFGNCAKKLRKTLESFYRRCKKN